MKLEDVMSLQSSVPMSLPLPPDGPPMNPEDMIQMLEEVKDATAAEKDPMMPKDA